MEPLKYKGKDFTFLLEKNEEMNPVCCGRDLSVSIQSETIELTKSPNSNWKSFVQGDRSFSISSSALFILKNSFLFENFFTALNIGTTLTFVTRLGNNADLLLTGKVIITSLEVVGSYKDVVQYSVTATGTGELSNLGTIYEYTLTDGNGNPLTDGEGNTLTSSYYSGELPDNTSIEC